MTSTHANLSLSLSDEEIAELDRFLTSDATSDATLLLDALDGYLTAIAIGPSNVPLDLWLPVIWGLDEEDAPQFKSQAEAQRIMGLIFRHLNGIIDTLQRNPDAINPMFESIADGEDGGHYMDAEMWCHGFLMGVQLNVEDWEPLFQDEEGGQVIYPIFLFAADDLPPEEMAFIETPGQREGLTNLIPDSIACMYRFWQPFRTANTEGDIANTPHRRPDKAGRNDDCPCGSGKKFKKCCGSATVLH